MRRASIQRAVLLLASACLTTASWVAYQGFSSAPPRDRTGDPLPPFALARLGTTRWVHRDNISAVAFSPDGRMLATAGHDGILKIYRADSDDEAQSSR